MQLPQKQTCGGCIHADRCIGMFGAKASNTYCGFFPRRFRAPEPLNERVRRNWHVEPDSEYAFRASVGRRGDGLGLVDASGP